MFPLTLKETTFRVGEAAKLKWVDIDSKCKLLTPNTPEKNGNPDSGISSKIVNMLVALAKNKQICVWNTQQNNERRAQEKEKKFS